MNQRIEQVDTFKNLRPIKNRIIIQVDPPETHIGSLEVFQPRSMPQGTILAIGPDVRDPDIQVGLRVVFDPTHVALDYLAKDDTLMIWENSLWGVLGEGANITDYSMRIAGTDSIQRHGKGELEE